MWKWFTDLFLSPDKGIYPMQISELVTKTSPNHCLVGPRRPATISAFDYLKKTDAERVAKPSPFYNSESLDGYISILKKEIKMNNTDLQTQLMQAVSYHFDKDAIRPGVVTSSLRSGKIYASVVRYGKQFVGGKQVVAKAQGDELKEVLTNLSQAFLATVSPAPNPVESLKKLVSDKAKNL